MNDDPLERLVLELGRLPGVGKRSAARLAHYILKVSQKSSRGERPSLAADLAKALLEVEERVRLCSRCRNFSVSELCTLCADSKRDTGTVCVVESVSDLRAIEASASYRGLYFVLHGALSPLDGVGPSELQLDVLTAMVGSGVSEVILATNANAEGDATAMYISQLLKSRPQGIRVTRLASGVPLGGELEYIDQATLGRALDQRRELD